MDASEVVTLAIAVAGLLLGIRSAWKEHKRDRVPSQVNDRLRHAVWRTNAAALSPFAAMRPEPPWQL
jgi:hypothetical protein